MYHPDIFSRLTKKETDTAPSADIVWKLAKYLGVSTDMLIEGDFSKATHNLQYMRNFVLKLKAMTDSNKLEWGAITIQDINSALQNEEDGEETLPIIAHRENAALNIKEMQIRKDARYRDCSLPEYGNKRVNHLQPKNVFGPAVLVFKLISAMELLYYLQIGREF